jgi:uncharacterized protein YcbX
LEKTIADILLRCRILANPATEMLPCSFPIPLSEAEPVRVTGIFIYPIKATAAISLEEAEVQPRGLAGDRRWVVVDEEGQFLQQRTHPKLATVRTLLQDDGGLQVTAAGTEPLRIAVPEGRNRQSVTVWSDTVDAADAGEGPANWFSQFMGIPCRLMFMDATAHRSVAPQYGSEGDIVSFADAMPLLMATEASLDDLNDRLDNPIPMSRFRPNLVINGETPWVDDDWKRLRVGDVEFQLTHPCARCVVITIDQETGQKSPDGEPLKTLAIFRRAEEGVLFGQNLVPRSGGVIRLNDEVTVTM